MKRALLVLVLAALSFAQKGKPPAEDPDERWACRLGSYHKCECASMVSEVLDAHAEHCKVSTKDAKSYEACMNSAPAECSIIAKADDKHSQHSCKRTCTKARCRCLEESCFLPPLGNDGNTEDR